MLILFRPWADAVRAGVGSVMCSYQQVNNSYACQNSHMINYLLKGELGFQGFVMSDWAAQHSGVSSALAGLDMTMPGDTVFNSGRSYWGANLTIAMLNGTIPQWRLDDMATRIIAAWYVILESIFPLWNRTLCSGTCLGIVHSLEMFQSSPHPPQTSKTDSEMIMQVLCWSGYHVDSHQLRLLDSRHLWLRKLLRQYELRLD